MTQIKTQIFPDPAEHAIAILEALEGDYQTALEFMGAYVQEYGEAYAHQLARLLRPAGEC
jgi:hypothetical protein